MAREVVVVGAGAAGLATARALGRLGIDALVLERAAAPGESWRRRYRRLRLNTLRSLSDQRGLRMDRRLGRWPAGAEYAAYLERYAAAHHLDVRTGVDVERIDRSGGGWSVVTSAGAEPAAAVAVATGLDHTPWMPEWPGRRTFTGALVHAADYADAAPYAGRRVLVVGAGNSAADIATDLAEAGAAWVGLAVRTPPHVLPREFLGVPLGLSAVLLDRAPVAVFDAAWAAVHALVYGGRARRAFGRPPVGPKRALLERDVAPTADGGIVRLVLDGRVEVVAAVAGFEGSRVCLAGGASVEVDAVIAGTGYRRGLEPLVGHLGVLDERGMPRVAGGLDDPSAPGLVFVGYRPMVSGVLHAIRAESEVAARTLSRTVRAYPQPRGRLPEGDPGPGAPDRGAGRGGGGQGADRGSPDAGGDPEGALRARP